MSPSLERAANGAGEAASAGWLAARMERSLAPPARDALRRAVELGSALGQVVHLVGGPVRDLLLGRLTADVDLMVEGESDELAGRLASALGGELRRHPEFLTATLLAPGGLRVDVASARAETYPGPAALPRVRPGSLRDDLERRDFAINAMALRLGGGAGPGLVDPLGGREDLARGRLRVLHRRSFEDDPSRILRGVRFETRLGFRLGEECEALARAALAGGAFARLSGSRLRRELALLAAEGGAPESFARLAELGVLAALEPRLELAGTARALLERVEEGVAWSRRPPPVEPAGEPLRAHLLALVQAQPEVSAERLAERLGLAGRDRERLVAGRQRLAEARARLERPEMAPHEIAAALAGLGTEELLAIRALAPPPVPGRIEQELRHHRRLELRIAGADLLARGHRPGPAIGRALAATRAARLDGRIGADGELDFALERLAAERGGGAR